MRIIPIVILTAANLQACGEPVSEAEVIDISPQILVAISEGDKIKIGGPDDGSQTVDARIVLDAGQESLLEEIESSFPGFGTAVQCMAMVRNGEVGTATCFTSKNDEENEIIDLGGIVVLSSKVDPNENYMLVCVHWTLDPESNSCDLATLPPQITE